MRRGECVDSWLRVEHRVTHKSNIEHTNTTHRGDYKRELRYMYRCQVTGLRWMDEGLPYVTERIAEVLGATNGRIP